MASIACSGPAVFLATFFYLLSCSAGDGAVHFPVFTAFIFASVLRSTLLFTLQNREVAYKVAYIATDFLDAGLQLAVVYELARHVFRRVDRWAPDVKRGMAWLGAGSLALASALTLLGAPSGPVWERTLLLKISFFTSALMSELFLGMIVLSVTAGLPWRTHVARIAQGLGAYSIVDVGLEAVHTVHGAAGGSNIRDILTLVRMSVYLACLFYWISTLWLEAPAPRELPPKVLEDLRSLQARVAYDLYTLRSWRKP